MGKWLAVMCVAVARDLARGRRGASASLRLMPLSRVALELAVLACVLKKECYNQYNLFAQIRQLKFSKSFMDCDDT
jgi:hypothetical protein